CARGPIATIGSWYFDLW
nr:immunoglobulin heavy chain junction region [Macaca mulatta]MOV39942.1 immunoglobulin heavy chain junction region [Macaca mulatta]MOV40756.1 immunoglobulin heavy chain junction region [Macaca mulatta]MOV41015.1 immunoglobulin heavy chain junction region [Macaca mulatta]MOV42052.1 immunoglobulin heavy chain junction region [Macaca mulatta]